MKFFYKDGFLSDEKGTKLHKKDLSEVKGLSVSDFGGNFVLSLQKDGSTRSLIFRKTVDGELPLSKGEELILSFVSDEQLGEPLEKHLAEIKKDPKAFEADFLKILAVLSERPQRALAEEVVDRISLDEVVLDDLTELTSFFLKIGQEDRALKTALLSGEEVSEEALVLAAEKGFWKFILTLDEKKKLFPLDLAFLKSWTTPDFLQEDFLDISKTGVGHLLVVKEQLDGLERFFEMTEEDPSDFSAFSVLVDSLSAFKKLLSLGADIYMVPEAVSAMIDGDKVEFLDAIAERKLDLGPICAQIFSWPLAKDAPKFLKRLFELGGSSMYLSGQFLFHVLKKPEIFSAAYENSTKSLRLSKPLASAINVEYENGIPEEREALLASAAVLVPYVGIEAFSEEVKKELAKLVSKRLRKTRRL